MLFLLASASDNAGYSVINPRTNALHSADHLSDEVYGTCQSVIVAYTSVSGQHLTHMCVQSGIPIHCSFLIQH